ncbi:MAG: ketopantoate reductase family protein [Zoogloeaceae bacterium]|jgi:2-dehydropantoate 2-reductase|nr:ketopantoate reductase family protein [Zoogloeaceae bacterium]
MNIAIFGAGAIGTYLAARLVASGLSITLIARARTAGKILESGLCVEEDETPMLRIFPKAGGLAVSTAARAQETGARFDALLITTKSQQILPALPEIEPLIAPHTLIACLQNGIPWWYFQGQDGRPLQCLDPDNAIPAILPARQLLGGVIHKSVDLRCPGHALARHAPGDRFIFGSPLPDGYMPEGEATLLAAFRAAELSPQKSTNIRRDVWEKLLGNAVLNPLSALANASIADIVDFAPACALSVAAIRETLNVAAAYHVTLDVSPEERLNRARAVGRARSSMLQDKIRHRPLETEGILGGLLELAQRKNIPVPRLETLYAATTLLSRHSAPGIHA